MNNLAAEKIVFWGGGGGRCPKVGCRVNVLCMSLILLSSVSLHRARTNYFFQGLLFFKDFIILSILYYMYKEYLKCKRCFLRSSQQISSIAIVLNYSLISPSNLFNKNVITNEENIGH